MELLISLFSYTLEGTVAASLILPLVLLLRLILKQAPKWTAFLLWTMVALQLVIPYEINSPISLVPEGMGKTQLFQWEQTYVDNVEIIHQTAEGYDTAVAAGRTPIPAEENGYYVVTAPDKVSAPETVRSRYYPMFSVLWTAGITALMGYSLVSTLRLRRRVDTAVRLRGNIYQSEFIDSPFVLGIFRPRIYLPYGIDGRDIAHVIAHEQTHIRRKDPLWKILGFALLTLHWFNPLTWLSYILFCRDMELACDEAVIRSMNNEQKANYARALLVCSVRHKAIVACPVAFGELGVKERVESVAAYKKPALWVTAAAVLVCLLAAACFMTNSGQPTTEDKASAAVQQLSEVSYYLELAAYEHSFENMDADSVDVLLSEYGPLTDGFELLARQTTDGHTKYILGVWDEEQGPNPLEDMHTMYHSPARSDEDFEVICHRDDSEAVDLALMNGEIPENAYIIKNSWLHNASRNNLFLIIPNDNALSLWDALYIYLYNPNGKAYIAGAAERGVTITTNTPPYLEFYLISPEYGEISERINLTQQQAADILNEPRVPLEDGYGFSAFLEWNGATRFYEKSGIPPTVLQYAVESCGYEFLRPADITGEITAARLDCDWLEEPRIADAADLPRLQEILTNAEFGFVGACGYGAKLVVTLSDGRELTLFKGTDGCDSMVFGSFGGYFIGDEETMEFWDMFGLDLETKQPIE